MSHRSIGRCLVAVSLAALLLPASAHAISDPLPDSSRPPIGMYTGPRKPAVTSHPDTAPPLPGGVEASVAPTQPAAPEAAVPSPDGSGDGAEHEVDSPASGITVATAFDGKNNVSFGHFADGDMIVVFDVRSVVGHAGLFDRRYYTGLSSFAVWSANVAPANGVQRESCEKFRAYDQAYGLWVPSEANHGAQARDFAARQIRKPYSLLAAKTDYRSFYCSKLAWAAWRTASGLNIDGDGGYWVWPIDLINSRYTATFGVWS